MAKKSMIARDVKRKKMVERFAAKRAALMEAFNSAEDPMDRLEIHPQDSGSSPQQRSQSCAQPLLGDRQAARRVSRLRPVPQPTP